MSVTKIFYGLKKKPANYLSIKDDICGGRFTLGGEIVFSEDPLGKIRVSDDIVNLDTSVSPSKRYEVTAYIEMSEHRGKDLPCMESLLKSHGFEEFKLK